MTGQRQARRTDLPAAPGARAHPARIHDCFLGGSSHLAADARAAAAITAAMPVAPAAARTNRDFLLRATRLLTTEFGIRQFLDLGSGFLTAPNLHQTAQALAPDARVVYADNDPVVLRHARAVLDAQPGDRMACMQADLTDPDSVLDAPELSDTLDLGRPVALSVDGLLHFVSDSRRPYEVLETLLGALPAGSFLVLTHATADFVDAGTVEAAQCVLGVFEESGSPLRPRSRDEIEQFFHGLRLLEPGVVPPQLWRPEGATARVWPGGAAVRGTGPGAATAVPGYAGVALKP